MELELIEGAGGSFLESHPEQAFVSGTDVARSVIEACFAYQVHSVILYAPNLPPAFFDLSSGYAGNLLQRLQNYRVRLALVSPPGSIPLSSRFADLLTETQRNGDFGVFATQAEAREWLGQKAG